VKIAVVFGTQVVVVTYDVHAQVFSADAPVADAAAAFVWARFIVQAVNHAPAVGVAAVVVRAGVAVVAHKAFAEVLSAHALNADVTRTAGRPIAEWGVVTLITGRTATKKIEPNKDTFAAVARVAAIAAAALIAKIATPRHQQRPERQQKQHKTEQPTHEHLPGSVSAVM
jgi:hypothetical protein